MHELSVALEVCRMAAEQAAAAGARYILEVGVEVGERAGVEPHNLEFCLEALLVDPPFLGARSCVRIVPGDALRLSYVEVEDGRPPD